MRLENKVAVVTGGASGIGRATALKFAVEGAKVVVADFNEEGGKATVEHIIKNGGEAAFKKVDTSKFEQVEEVVDFAVETFGRIDVIFNNAGIGINKPLLDHDVESYHKVTSVNQDGVYHGILAASRKMVELGIHGTIINTASVFAFLASPGVISYHAAKGAVKMMTQSAALELAKNGIRVVAVAPGGVDTNIIQGYKDAGLGEHLAKQQMTGKLLQPEQIANVVAFLASDEASGINGSTVLVDDGYASFK